MYYIYVTFGPSLLTEYYRLCDKKVDALYIETVASKTLCLAGNIMSCWQQFLYKVHHFGGCENDSHNLYYIGFHLHIAGKFGGELNLHIYSRQIKTH